jgi:hypothetical protein
VISVLRCPVWVPAVAHTVLTEFSCGVPYSLRVSTLKGTNTVTESSLSRWAYWNTSGTAVIWNVLKITALFFIIIIKFVPPPPPPVFRSTLVWRHACTECWNRDYCADSLQSIVQVEIRTGDWRTVLRCLSIWLYLFIVSNTEQTKDVLNGKDRPTDAVWIVFLGNARALRTWENAVWTFVCLCEAYSGFITRMSYSSTHAHTYELFY